jgi:hypothetical protein
MRIHYYTINAARELERQNVSIGEEEVIFFILLVYLDII